MKLGDKVFHMKWELTGDWQTRFSNLKECRQAHEQEISIIKENDIEGHIDLGDMKDEYSPVAVEVVEFQFARTKAIQELIDPNNTIKLGGNHDRIGQNSDERSWLSLFTYLGGHVIVEADVVFCPSLSIFGLPYSSDIDKFLEGADYLAGRAERVDSRKILIFHQEVRDVRFSKLRGKLSDSRITVEALHADSYLQSFGGHIHLRQKLARNVRFIGSPFAIDWGEIDQRKGFTIYDDKEDKVEFIESWVPGRYSYAYLQKNDVKRVSDGTQIKDTVICESVGSNYHRRLDGRVREIAKDYPNAIINVVPKFSGVNGGGKEAQVTEQSSEDEKLRLYIRASLPLALKKKKDSVEAYLQSILEQCLGRRIRNTDKIVFEKMEATNVLSFEHVEFDFDRRGTIVIAGENKSGGVLASNGAGKTNFLSMPCVALTGKTFKGQQHDNWANWRTKGAAVVSQSFRNHRGDMIEVVRGRRPGKLQVLINGDDRSEGMRQSDVQKQIEELTGFTYDTLANSVYVDQSLSNAFILGTDKSRAELISKFLNLDKYEFARELAGKDLKKIKSTIEDTEYEISILRDTIKDNEKDLKSHYTDIAKKRRKITESLKEAKRELEHETRKTSRKTAYLKKGLLTLTDKVEKLEDEEKEVSSQLYMLNQIIENFQKNMLRVRKVSKLDNCPECLRAITDEVRTEMYERAKRMKEKKEAEAAALVEQEKELRRKLRKYASEVEVINDRIESALKCVKDSAQRVEDLENRLEVFDELELADAKIEKAKDRIAKAERKISVSKAFIRDSERQAAIVEFAVEAFGRKGFPAFLSKLTCPVLNASAEYYSDLFLDGEIKVVFDVVDDVITPKIVNPNGDKEIQGQSAGEKAWAGQISSFALREVAQPSNLLILDEPGHGLDPEGAKRFGQRIRKLESRFDTILITTHNILLQAALEGTSSITIVKDKKISRIQ
jgi:hypothetical protein